MSKRNPELPGMERPAIPAIDSRVGPYLQLRNQRDELTKQLQAAKEAMHAAMTASRGELEENDDGEPCYVFADGAASYAIVLRRGEEACKVSKISDEADEL